MGEFDAKITDDGVDNVALKKARSNFRLKVSRQSTALHFGDLFLSLSLCLESAHKRYGGGRVRHFVRVDH